jgi:hypothetical protein
MLVDPGFLILRFPCRCRHPSCGVLIIRAFIEW